MEFYRNAGGPFCGIRKDAFLGKDDGIGAESCRLCSDGIVHLSGVRNAEALDRDRAQLDKRTGRNCFQNLDFIRVGGIVESLGGFGYIYYGTSGEECEE